TARRTVHTRSRRSMSEWHIPELKEGKKRGRKEEGDEKKKKEEAKKRKRKKKEEEEAERKKEEDAKRKKKEEEAERKKEEEEDAKRKKKKKEEDQRKKKEEQDEHRKKKKRRGSSPDDFRYHKATKVNVSTSEPIYVDSQESTDTLPRGKKEERRDYVAREALGVAEKSLIERFLNECIINEDFMFNGTVEGYEIFLSFNDIRELLFVRESESIGYVQSCKDDKSKEQHFDYAFGKLDRAPNEFDLIFSTMHVGTNHWALLVIHIKEKEFHVYDSLRNKDRRDIPQYVEELKRYLNGKHIDADKWPLRYLNPCPQQGSGDDCSIFTCK
ncbi:hypothetical protein Taro_053411, partial [Colocasia esculenta]|nr:hypothetical protein [Colocasia esculenta]